MTAAAQIELDYMHEATNLVHVFAFLPWLARAEPENLYLPATLVRAHRLGAPCLFATASRLRRHWISPPARA